MKLPSQKFVYTRTYSRWQDAVQRREFMEESIKRTIDFFASEIPQIKPVHKKLAMNAMAKQDVMPSMRAFWAAGDAARNNNVTLYNCAFTIVSDVFCFSEILYILMCGTGVGFSVEKKFIDQLPVIGAATGTNVHVIVEDSKEGWAESLDVALKALFNGHTITADFSRIRPRGARLRTMGGRASGPDPLRDLFNFASNLFKERAGKKLRPIDCLDLVCKIAEIVVVGGVRRSSLICLFDAEDRQVAEAKMGEFWRENPHRAMSNNSAVFESKPSEEEFLMHWLTLMKSGSGEPGIFNREAAIKQMVFSGRRKAHLEVGTNPCGEISLRPYEFCNLSEVVVRAGDSLDTLKNKVRVAAMIGSWQATMVNFPYLRKEWKKNCTEERLLGVSLTGIQDHAVLSEVFTNGIVHVGDECKKWLSELKHVAIRETAKWAKKLDIKMSAAITCVKPSGTVSQMVDSASGIHPRYAKYYIRRYRISATDPLFRMLRDQGVPCHPEVGQEPHTASTWVLEFPVAAPEGAKTRHDFTAIQQLEHWKVVKEFWCEHNPSITVYVNKNEWLEVGAWCFKNWDYLVGVAFLPKENHVYRLAPYEEISSMDYSDLLEAFPEIDYSQLTKYEMDDNTTGAQTLACVGGVCEI